ANRLGRETFMLAGHDWGGIVAWACAIRNEDRVGRLAILNAPHPNVFWDYARTHPAQVLRSWYVFFMQLPWLPEFVCEAGNFRVMTETLAKTSRPGAFSEPGFLRLSRSLASARSANRHDKLVPRLARSRTRPQSRA